MTLDDSIEAHDRFAREIKQTLATAADNDNNSAFYVQAFVVAKFGEPSSVWRWDPNEDLRWRETTCSALTAELSDEPADTTT